MRYRYITKLEQIEGLTEEERARLKMVIDRFAFRTNEYYLSLIDWDDPDDPIRRIIIPDMDELEDWGRLDPSDEVRYTVMQGVEHKYHATALFLASNVCGGICRYCFRKRIFIHKDSELLTNLPMALDYVRSHPEVTNVLLTGGDPLMLATSKLKKIMMPLMEIDHVRIVRLGSKIPAFNPYRILDDPSLLELIEECTETEKKVYVITHFNHPKELTSTAIKALKELHGAGAILANQTPLIRGLNDDPDTLADLFKKLSFVGVPPYYVFQCRPALGNRTYAVPVEEGYLIFERAKAKVSGLAKRARYVMSHVSGKIEIVGLTEDHIFFKYHQAANDADYGRFMVYRRNPAAYWFDDYDEVVEDLRIDIPMEPSLSEREIATAARASSDPN